MVTNAQFPEQIKNLYPVTQLYVSVDAGTKEALKKVDRPLFSDFWERFLKSIDFLKQKNQRTIFRLTLVRNWNDDDVKDYCELVLRGQPSFIEIKAVTYCGQGNDSELRIANTLYHEEVITFSNKLINILIDYDIACEHEHSNCVLLANKKFFIDDQWCTWIDYDKFNLMYNRWKESKGHFIIKDVDYSIPTPDWALFGSSEQGFNPDEIRYRRKKI
ncbi:hypothetical protein HZS_3439 [Henneguya salminicola]|nr:hypothetical protein HZS_3439 [Henneguya salminicola]